MRTNHGILNRRLAALMSGWPGTVPFGTRMPVRAGIIIATALKGESP